MLRIYLASAIPFFFFFFFFGERVWIWACDRGSIVARRSNSEMEAQIEACVNDKSAASMSLDLAIFLVRQTYLLLSEGQLKFYGHVALISLNLEDIR